MGIEHCGFCNEVDKVCEVYAEKETRGAKLTPEEKKKAYGKFPVKNSDEWRELPLPFHYGTWKKEVKAVVFKKFFGRSGVSANVYVHPGHAFRVLWTGDLYQVTGVVYETPTGRAEPFAKWKQDPSTGAYCIVSLGGDYMGTQGGYNGHIPANCYRDKNGEWRLWSGNNYSDDIVCHG